MCLLYSIVYSSLYMGHSMPNQHEKRTTPQIFTKLGLQVVPHDLLAQIKFWPQKLCGFYFTAL